MPKQNWLSKTESARRTLLNNLANKLPGPYADKYGITPDELTRLEDFRRWYNWTADTLEAIRQKAQGYTAFRDALCHGKGTATGAHTLPPALALAATPTRPPTPPATTPEPIIPVANGWKFTASLVNRIKGHADYTEADGQDLGIIGAEEQGANPETTQPELKLVRVAGGHIEVQWKKSGFTGVRIEVDRGTGQWAFLAIDTEPHYTDTLALAPGTTALWKYRAIYLDGDEPFGQWSATATIAVQG